MLRYIYYRCCKHHVKGKRQNQVKLLWNNYVFGLTIILLLPVLLLLLGILKYNSFTAFLAFLIWVALILVINHHIEKNSKTYRPPKRYKALNRISMTKLAYLIILPLEIVYVIGSTVIVIKLLNSPLHLDGLLARCLSGLF